MAAATLADIADVKAGQESTAVLDLASRSASQARCSLEAQANVI